MFLNVFQRVFGSTDDRYLKKLNTILVRINSYEDELTKLSDAELKQKTILFKKDIAAGKTLDQLLPEVFATVREAAKRSLGMRHYDVQMMGGIVLHRGEIAEMATGEGKTLMSTLPVYLNALKDDGVHVVTVNDYLAERDSKWMGKLYEFMGLSVGCITNDMDDVERKKSYSCDITYATNNELGFDYLRDNMKFHSDEIVQRGFHYAIVDEVDSILIDEARTPLIISGPADDSSKLYDSINKTIPYLKDSDYEKDEKNKSITFTESGNHNIEKLLRDKGVLQEGSLYEVQNISLVHHVNQALRAHKMFHRDVDYIVKDNQVIIIDEFTGRMMDGRRYSDGLHQALEAKENVEVQMENQTLASITFQNYFRLYNKLSGMTGTAKTEAAELSDIYNLEVIKVQTNLPVVRKDLDDEIYRTEKEKIDAITKLIQQCSKKQQPVLVGTTSIEKSEYISSCLTNANIQHKVLNARFHEQEAAIIAEAGAPGAVTIATNMAGRGTDIKLGGSVEVRLQQALEGVAKKDVKKITDKIYAEVKTDERLVKDAGGLYVIGTERHESRRVDNQLRGRSGRQGDPGESKFFLSLEDDLMRIFGSDKLDSMLQKLGLKEGEAIVHPWVSKALERAQQKVEARNYDIRKHLLKYDDVMNEQRKIVYSQRKDFMTKDDMSAIIKDMREDVLSDITDKFMPENTLVDQWNISALHTEALRIFGEDLPIKDWIKDEISPDTIYDKILDSINSSTLDKESDFGSEIMRVAEKSVLLRNLDSAWKDHLLALDHVRQGINLRAIAQRDPLNEYKSEAFFLFESMLKSVRESTISILSNLSIGTDSNREEVLSAFSDYDEGEEDFSYTAPQKASSDENKVPNKSKGSIRNRLMKNKASSNTPNRNALCSCGSGKRYKHCCGKV